MILSVKDMINFVLEKKLQDIADWLSPATFDEKQYRVFSQHTPGTGEWLLNEPKFKTWLQGKTKLLWCYGNRKCCLHSPYDLESN
jgi:hypothetical protein